MREWRDWRPVFDTTGWAVRIARLWGAADLVVRPPESVGVDDEVHRRDPAVPDGAGHGAENLPIALGHGPGRAIDHRRSHQGDERPALRQDPLRDLLGAGRLELVHTWISLHRVHAEDDVRVEDVHQRLEVARARRRQEGVDYPSLLGDVRIAWRCGAAHP